MVDATSGYMNGVSGLYNYSYNNMRSVSSDYNDAEVNRTDNRQSYINNDAVRYVASIQANARDMLDSLESVSTANTFDRMRTAYENAANDPIDDGTEAVERLEPERRPPEPVALTVAPGEARGVFEAVNNSTAASATGGEDADTGQGAFTVVNDATEATVAGGEAANTGQVAFAAAESTRTAVRTARTETGTARAFDAGAVRDMVGSFNRLFEAAEAGPGNNRLVQDLRDTAESYAGSLSRVGITVNEDGALSVDENRLDNAERTGALEATFATGGGNDRFANQLVRIAENVTGNRQVNEAPRVNEAENTQNRAVMDAVETYRQNTDNYNYAYGYSAPGTLFNLYA